MPDLIEAVYNADPSDEFDWLEWKSTLDLATKHAWSHIARAVLGPANRMPNAAAAVGGYAYLLVGVEPRSIAGVVPVDPAELDRGVCAYTGTADGPRWRAFYVGYGGKQVLVVEVSPPVWGDPLFTAHKEGDRLKDGDILVRRPGSTRQATSAEVALLVQRAARSSATLAVVVSAGDETVVPQVDASLEAQAAWFDGQRRHLMLPLEGQDTAKDAASSSVVTVAIDQSALSSNLPDLSGIAGAFEKSQALVQQAIESTAFAFRTVPERRTREEFVTAVDEYLETAEAALPKVLTKAAGKVLPGIRFRLHNPGTRTLAAVEVTMTASGVIAIPRGRGFDWYHMPLPPREYGPKRSSIFEDFNTRPELPMITSALGPTQPSPPRPAVATQADGKTKIVFPTVELRALGTVTLAEVVLYSIGDGNTPVELSWSATSSNVEGVAQGTITIPIDSVTRSIEDLLEHGADR